MMQDPNYHNQMVYMQQMLMDPQQQQNFYMQMLSSGYSHDQILAMQQQYMSYGQTNSVAQFYGQFPMMQATGATDLLQQ